MDKLKKDNIQKYFTQIGFLMTKLGYAIFILTFWLNYGWLLGGNDTFLGPKFTELEVIFPYAGAGIFLVFFGNLFLGNKIQIKPSFMIFVLLFLSFLAINAFFSINQTSSILYLIIWATGILATTFDDSFVINDNYKRCLLAFSLLVGILLSKFAPDTISQYIAVDLIAFAGLLGVISAVKEGNFAYRSLLIIFYSWSIFLSYNFWIIAFSIMVLWFVKLWFRVRQKSETKIVLVPVLALLSFLFFGLWQGLISFEIWNGGLHNFFASWKNVLLGVGQGEFLSSLQKLSENILSPENFLLPTSGIIHSFYELGILGTLFIILFLFSGKFFDQKSSLLLPIIVLSFWILSNDFWSLENVIITSCAFGFVRA